MPKVKSALPIDTVLNEFVYTALFQASYEQKRGLKGKFLRACISERSARAFAANSTREDKEHVLAHLGYEFYYVVNKSGKAQSSLTALVPVVATGKRNAIGRAIAEMGVFVTSEREILRTVGLVSRHTHHPSFYLDLEILRQGYHIKKWSRRYSTEKDMAFRDTDENSRAIAKILLNSIIAKGNSHGLFGCSETELMILSYLYQTQEIETTDEALKDFFAGRISNIQYRYALKNLVLTSCIQRMKDKYSITGAGIKKVNYFIKETIHSNNF